MASWFGALWSAATTTTAPPPSSSYPPAYTSPTPPPGVPPITALSQPLPPPLVAAPTNNNLLNTSLLPPLFSLTPPPSHTPVVSAPPTTSPIIAPAALPNATAISPVPAVSVGVGVGSINSPVVATSVIGASHNSKPSPPQQPTTTIASTTGGTLIRDSTINSAAQINPPQPKIVQQQAKCSSILAEIFNDSLPSDKLDEALSELSDMTVAHHHLCSLIGNSIPDLIKILKEGNRYTPGHAQLVLQILCEICTPQPATKQVSHAPDSSSVEKSNAESVIKHIGIIINLIELRAQHYYIRYYTAHLLRTLLGVIRPQLQSALMDTPLAIGRVVDLLADEREAVRNEGLLLLQQLCNDHQEIQKLAAFEGCFEKILHIITQEGGSEGGIVVGDCLALIITLLTGNVSNKNNFRESGCIRGIVDLLDLLPSDMWLLTDNKLRAILLTLDIIRLLLSKNNTSDLPRNQAACIKAGILNHVISIALGQVNSLLLRVRALYALGDLLHSNPESRSLFTQACVLVSDKPISAVLRLTTVALNTNEMKERAATLFAFQNYLCQNEEGQVGITSMLTPSPTAGDRNTSFAALLLPKLYGWDTPTTNQQPPMIRVERVDSIGGWCAAMVLLQLLQGCNASKELLLKIPLTIPSDGKTILIRVFEALKHSTSVTWNSPCWICVGLLRVLLEWLNKSRPACEILFPASLAQPNFIYFLELSNDSQASIHIQGLAVLILAIALENLNDELRNSFYTIAQQKGSVDQLMNKLDQLRKSSEFVVAEKHVVEEPPAEETSLHIYDHSFTLFFKDSYDRVTNSFKNSPNSNPTTPCSTQPTQLISPSQPIPTPTPIVKPSTSPSLSSSPLPPTPAPLVPTPTVTPVASLTAFPQSPPMKASDLPFSLFPSPPSADVVQSYKNVIAHQERELETLKKHSKDLETKLKQTAQQLSGAQKNSEAHESQELMSKRVTELEKSLLELNQTSRATEHSLKTQNAALSSQVSTLSKSLADFANVRQESEELRNQNSSLQKKLTEVETNLSNFKIIRQQELDALNQKINMDASKYEAVIQSLNQQLETARCSLLRQPENQTWQEEKQRMEEFAAVQNSKISELGSSLVSKEEELTLATMRCKQFENLAQDAQTKLNETIARAETAEGNFAEIRDLMNMVEEEKKEVEEERNQLLERTQELEAAKAQMTAELHSLSYKLLQAGGFNSLPMSSAPTTPTPAHLPQSTTVFPGAMPLTISQPPPTNRTFTSNNIAHNNNTTPAATTPKPTLNLHPQFTTPPQQHPDIQRQHPPPPSPTPSSANVPRTQQRDYPVLKATLPQQKPAATTISTTAEPLPPPSNDADDDGSAALAEFLSS
ncbi:General vesicular transport factor p115 [Pelomyxa schiedti]|nr:General vesicular transport factor p115 [Pelomyxa schiedti]